ncbi:MAG: tetratricopeptide repeat protein [Bacteroidota bacterium]
MKKSTFAFIFTFLILGLALPTQAQQHKGHPFEEVGRSLSRKGKELLRIVDNYSRALASDPYNGGYYNNRAAAYFDNGDYRKAILDYTKAIQFTDNKYVNRMARMYYKRGLCYYILGSITRRS